MDRGRPEHGTHPLLPLALFTFLLVTLAAPWLHVPGRGPVGWWQLWQNSATVYEKTMIAVPLVAVPALLALHVARRRLAAQAIQASQLLGVLSWGLSVALCAAGVRWFGLQLARVLDTGATPVYLSVAPYAFVVGGAGLVWFDLHRVRQPRKGRWHALIVYAVAIGIVLGPLLPHAEWVRAGGTLFVDELTAAVLAGQGDNWLDGLAFRLSLVRWLLALALLLALAQAAAPRMADGATKALLAATGLACLAACVVSAWVLRDLYALDRLPLVPNIVYAVAGLTAAALAAMALTETLLPGKRRSTSAGAAAPGPRVLAPRDPSEAQRSPRAGGASQRMPDSRAPEARRR